MTLDVMRISRRQWFLSSGAAALTAARGGGSPVSSLVASPMMSQSTPRKSPRAIKFLFFDPWALEYVRGFQRRLVQPSKYSENPIFKPESSAGSTFTGRFSVIPVQASSRCGTQPTIPRIKGDRISVMPLQKKDTHGRGQS